MKNFIRKVDSVGRWGGEEFIIICPKTNKKEAILLAEKIRNKISLHKFNKTGTITASFGVSSYKENESLDTVLSKADEAMYLSKYSGKNKVSSK